MIPQIFTINLLQFASGDRSSIQVYRFCGSKPGKKAYLQANLHGAEIVGNGVIHQLIEFFSTLEANQLEGEVWLVPVCNPLATNQRNHFFSTGRFNSYDGKDWNRIFWDYEKEEQDLEAFARAQLNQKIEIIRQSYLQQILACFQKKIAEINSPQSLPWTEQYRYHLQSLCLDANYVIDIHSSSNQAIDYLYCFPNREESAQYFLLEHGILMDRYDGYAFDEAFLKPWLGLEKELAKQGREVRFDLESWTLELGSGMIMEVSSVAKGVAGIKNYLLSKGMLHSIPNLNPVATDIRLANKSKILKYYAPVGGMVQKLIKIGTKVKPNTELYQIINFNRDGKVPTVIKVCADTDGLVFDSVTNHAVNQGDYILSLFRY